MHVDWRQTALMTLLATHICTVCVVFFSVRKTFVMFLFPVGVEKTFFNFYQTKKFLVECPTKSKATLMSFFGSSSSLVSLFCNLSARCKRNMRKLNIDGISNFASSRCACLKVYFFNPRVAQSKDCACHTVRLSSTLVFNLRIHSEMFLLMFFNIWKIHMGKTLNGLRWVRKCEITQGFGTRKEAQTRRLERGGKKFGSRDSQSKKKLKLNRNIFRA